MKIEAIVLHKKQASNCKAIPLYRLTLEHRLLSISFSQTQTQVLIWVEWMVHDPH